jgi:hypothetical protein
MRKAYFHIGFGKTGTSSLQSFLSFNPLHYSPGSGETLLYCCFDNKGRIFTKKELQKRAANSPLKYVSSYPAITKLTGEIRTQALDALWEEGYTPVFSQEDWGRQAGNFKQMDFFSRLRCKAHVIVYVRPQVEWFNSGWWQWWNWTGQFKNPEDVFHRWGYGFLSWATQVAQWKRLKGVEEVTVRLQPTDVVSDFLSVCGVNTGGTLATEHRFNVGLSPTHIKLLKRFPSLRTTHSAYIDFLMARLLRFEGKTPWIVGPKLAESIIEATRDDNLRLLDMLDTQSRALMEQDERWWRADAYREHRVWTGRDFELTRQEVKSALAQTVKALVRCGGAPKP